MSPDKVLEVLDGQWLVLLGDSQTRGLTYSLLNFLIGENFVLDSRVGKLTNTWMSPSIEACSST
jgi:hypothetical protein